LQQPHLLQGERIGVDGGLRPADGVLEQELDPRQLAALGAQQDDVGDLADVLLGDRLDEGGAQRRDLARERVDGGDAAVGLAA
jgi:hypothetical protein